MDITDASGAAADAAGGGYGSGSDGSDPFSGFADYADSPNVGPAYGSPSTEGDYGFAVFNAIDKVATGQPLTRGELQTLTDAGLGGMTAPSGRTVSEELSTSQQIRDILYGSFPNFSNINFGDIVSLYGPPAPAPVDEPGPGGVGVSEERTGDYGVPLASEGAAPVTAEEVEELPEDEEAEFQSVLSPPYGQLSPKAQDAYVNALAKRLSDDEAYIEALRTEDQELAFENKIQQLAAKEFVPTTPTDDSGAGGVDDPSRFEFAEEAVAPASVDYDRSLVFGDRGYGEGMTGAQTGVFDRTLNETGDVGAAVRAAAEVQTPPTGQGLGALGRRGGFGTRSRFGRTSALPPPAPAPVSDRSLKSVEPETLVREEETAAPDYSPDYLYGMEDRPVTPTTPSPGYLEETGLLGGPVDRAPATGGLGSIVDLLREGDISGALSLLRDTISTPATPAVDEQPLVDPLPPNVVGTGTPGGMLVDERGEPVLSTSYGLPGEYAPSGPTLDPALLESAAKARGMTVDELRAVIDAEIQGGSPVGTTGLSRETLEALQEKGFGGRDIGLEPGTQTVDQALASMQANQFLTDYLPTIIGMVGPPGTGALLSGVRTIGDLMQGKLSPGAAMTRELIGLLARQANIPASVLTNILEGKFGDAAANQAKSFMFNTLAQEAGVQGSAIGMIANELGFLNPLTGQIDRAVTQVIPDQNFGIPGRVAAGLDEFVGPIQGAVSQGLGALGDAAQTGLTGLGNVLGQIGQGVQTGVGAITGGIGDLVNTITGGGTTPVIDESGVGGVDDPSQFEFIEDRIYDTGTDLARGIDADVNAGIGSVIDESGVGGVDPDEFEFIEDRVYPGTDVATGIDDMVNAGLIGTGTVGLPGEELGEGILTGVDLWDQALIGADTGGVYDLDTGTGADTVTNVGGVGTDTGGGDTDTVVQPPPPVIPPTGGGTTQPYGSYFARVPTGYQVVQGLYGPIMQYTYGNLPLGGT